MDDRLIMMLVALVISNVLSVVVATAINRTDIKWLKLTLTELKEEMKSVRERPS